MQFIMCIYLVIRNVDFASPSVVLQFIFMHDSYFFYFFFSNFQSYESLKNDVRFR